MDIVNTIDDVKENLLLFEKYLCEGTTEEQIFAYRLIQKGSCFIAYKTEGELRFAPSRYIGYLKNTMTRHLNNATKDGKETNPAINKIIGYTLAQNSELEEQYTDFTAMFGIQPYNKNRKYWLLNLELPNVKKSVVDPAENFPEGKIIERSHKARERNTKLVLEAKKKFLKENGSLYCSACDFNFSKTYGERGDGYIEAHHIKPVSEMEPGQTTDINDIALVCANCHRILHRTRPWLSIDGLKEILNKA